ncbi:helix-turn-helix transcriptional regulator [Glycocaulis sp.]
MAAREIKLHTRLPMLRAERGMSRRELADALGVHYQTIGYIERGEYMPSMEIGLRAAALFGLPVEAIFSLDPFPTLDGTALLRQRQ